LLEQQPGWKVVGEVSTGAHLSRELNANQPDILLLEWNLPDLDSEKIIPSVKENYPKLAVIVMSGRPELKKKACSAGADAFVSKTEPPDKLLESILTISERNDMLGDIGG
jgi:DNA-binding NarL/FixJ family response regulator